MGWFSKVKDAGDGVKSAGEGVNKALSGVGRLAGDIRSAITGDINPQDKARLSEIALDLEKISREGQIEINKAEAQHSNLFVSGWRPMIGWIGAIALALFFLPQFVAGTFFWIKAISASGTLVAFPIAADGILELVLGLLGLGVLRTVEKGAGTSNLH